MKEKNGTLGASFRDPSGSIFFHEGILYRRINPVYAEQYKLFLACGLYESLTENGLLVEHEAVELDVPAARGAYAVIQPKPIPLVSYPYEWSFSQYKAAALCTLELQRMAMDHDMMLKDASAYNIQFVGSRPIFIDTLSFEKYEEGQVWTAYRQFCEHFLAPLALMAYCDVRLGQLMRIHLDGIPLDLASGLLPIRSNFRFSLLSHIHFHAKSQRHYAGRAVSAESAGMSARSLRALIESLFVAVDKLHWQPSGTAWGDYYNDTNYSTAAEQAKKESVSDYIHKVKPGIVWDIGGNIGAYSRLAVEAGAYTVSFDMDPAAVEKNYLRCAEEDDRRLLPLLCDLTNPPPAQGWAHDERMSLAQRGPADLAMALALIHHLAIANNVPLERVADYFAQLGRHLIIEFVPKTDSQVQRLLASRQDIFDDYQQEHFERAFGRRFRIVAQQPIRDSQRVLYLMERRSGSIEE